MQASRMAVMLFIYLTGSAIINVPEPLIQFARSGVWISLIGAYGAGVLLLMILLYLQRVYPGLTFVEYSRKALGNVPAALLAVLFIVMLVHINIGITLDVSLFLNSSMMRQTPMYVFHTLIFASCAFTVRAGIEVMVRLFMLLIVVMIVSIVIVLLLLLPEYDTSYLAPVFPNGIAPVLHGMYFAYGFPYAEIAVFAMLLGFVPGQEHAKLRSGLLIAMLLNAAMLIAASLCSLMVLGPVAAERQYSLFQVAQVVEVGNIIERIESIVGMAMIVGSYMKTSIAMLALNLTLTRVLGIRNERALVMPLALLLIMLTMDSWKGQARWIQIVSVIHPLWGTLSFVAPLAAIALATYIRRFRKTP